MKRRRINAVLTVGALALTLLTLTVLPLTGTAAPDLERQPLESLTELSRTEATESNATLSALSPPSAASVVQTPGTTTRISAALRSAPIMFIENVGQFADGARFQVRGATGTIWLAEDALWVTLLEPSLAETEQPQPAPTPGPLNVSEQDKPRQGVNIKLTFPGANPHPHLEPFNPLETHVSYFIGNDPAKWQPDVPIWGGVRYVALYPGVDLEISGENNQWTWRMVAQDVASLDAVRLHVEGADTVAVDDYGRLCMETAVGKISGPVVRTARGQVLMQAAIEGNTARFKPSSQLGVAPGSSSRQVTNPSSSSSDLVYSTFLGGSGFDAANAIAAGSGGIAYIAGETDSINFPTTPGAFDTTFSGGRDIFVAKLQSAGNALAFSTFIGGSGTDRVNDIVVDAAGSVYLAGESSSSNFPATPGAFDTTHNGGTDVVAVKLNATGNALLYSTYLGGASTDQGFGLTVDEAGAACVTGYTASSNFPTTPGVFRTSYGGSGDGFVVKLAPAGSELQYSTFLGSPGWDVANDVAVDAYGAAYVVGLTQSSSFPTTPGAFDTTFAGVQDAFVAKLNASGSSLVYSGLLGGGFDDQAQAVAVDVFGAAYIAGQTGSTNFTTTAGAYDKTLNGSWDGFVAKVSPDGSTLIYSTYLGGNGYDCETPGVERECKIAADASGVAYVAGRTSSTDFPTTSNGFDLSYNGNEDGFMVKLNPDGSSLVYSSFFGGSAQDQTLAVAVDTAGAAYVAGRTYSSNFPTSPGAFDTSHSGGADVFVIKLGVGGYTSGPRPDPNLSTISTQPTSLPADGVTSATITVQLLSASGEPAWGKTVRLSSSRGALDDIVQPATVTGSDGRTTGTIRSSTAGTATISAFVLDDGVLLSSKPSVTLQPYTPPSGEFLYQLNQTVDRANDSLRQIDEDAAAIANEGDYFRGTMDEDRARRVIDLAFNASDIVAGATDWYKVSKGIGVGLPGMKYTDGPWWRNIIQDEAYPDASRLFRTDVWYLLRGGTKEGMAEELGYTGAKFFAASLRDSGLKAVAKWESREDAKIIFADRYDGMTGVAYPAVRDAVQELKTLLNVQRDYLLANLPSITPENQNAYMGDLVGRRLALIVLGQQLRDERWTLANFRQSRQDHNGFQVFVLRFIAKGVATAAFDGPGAVAVGGTFAGFDYYMDTKRLEDSQSMYSLATGGLLGAPDALRQVYSTAYSGLDRIARGLPADRATGQINSVAHRSRGGYWGPFWNETASWSEVSLTNTGNSEATFRVLVGYLADTTRFGVPWATMNLVEEPTITLAPHTSGTVRVDYKRGNGTKGFSPRTETCIPLAGCSPASDITIDVLATNDAGTYYIGHDYSIWQPSRLTLSGARAPAQADSLTTIDLPLTTYVLSAPWTQKHETQLWINNPFTSTMAVTVTQALTQGITLLNLGGAVQNGNVLTWNTVVESSALNVVTFTFKFPATPGTENSLPPASLSLVNPLDGQPLTTDSNVATFQAIWPLTLDYATPGYVLPGSTSTVAITLTNWLSDSAITGTLAISVTDALSVTVYTESQSFSVTANATGAITFTLSATLAPGNYLVHGSASANGASAIAFTDPLQVGLPGPWLDYRVSPMGVVHPNDVLTYTLHFTNTVGVPLSGAVITASLPTSVTVIVASITGGGIVEPGQVCWTLGTVAVDQPVMQSFVVWVNADAASAGGEPGRLLSEPRLTANEIAPTWGPAAWNLVTTVPPSDINRVTTDTADDWRPAIARASDGKLWVVWDSWRSDDNIWYRTSDDNGVTWSADTQLTTDPSSDYDPAIMQASDGTIWVVWYSWRSGNADIWYKTSSDGGATWSAATQLTTDPSSDYSPAITQTNDGTIWVVWYSYRSGNADLWYTTSSDGGATWSSAVQLTTAPEGDYRPTIAQTSDGRIWVVWESWRSDHPGIWYKTSTDGGASWSADTEFSTDTNWDYAPVIGQTSDGTIWVARMSWSGDLGNWDIWYKTSNDGGTTWSADQQFTKFTGPDLYPGLAALPGNQVALVWHSDRVVNFDIWFGIIGVHSDLNPPPHLNFIQNYPWPNPDSNDTVTIRAWVSDETGITSVTLKWWVDGIPQADLTMYDDGAHDDYGADDGWYGVQIGPFPVGTMVEYQVEITDVDGNTILAPQYPIWFESLEPFVKTADILFVPDYGGYDTGWFRGYYEDALGTQGYQYDVWDTGKRGEIDSMTLNQYIDGAVIWAVPYWGFVTDYTSTRDVLQSYLDNGGNLFITGQNIGRSLAGTDFYQNYLHANYVQDNVGLYALSGVAGDPIGDGLSLSITGGDGANNQYSPDEIDPVSPAVTILTYIGGALGRSEVPLLEGTEEPEHFVEPGILVPERRPTQRKGPEQTRMSAELQGVVSSGSGAIRVDTGTYKVVYFAFGFEGINRASDRAVVMERVLAWLRGVLPRPTQISPANGSAVPVGDVTFTWNSVAGATGYQIQIDTTTAFTSPALISDTVTSTSYTATLTLGAWYWRVRALPDGPWTTAWQVRAAGPLVQVTADSDWDYTPSIAQTADGTLWVVWVSERSGNGDIWYKTSADSGTTWSVATQLTTDSDWDDTPAIIQAVDSTLWMVWSSWRSGNADIWYKTSADGGTTWSAASQFTTDPGDDYFPAIVQAADGTLWVVWTSERSGGEDIWYKTSSDGGITWSAGTQLTFTGTEWLPAITQAADGTLWVVWISERSGGEDIWYKTSSDGGITWSADTQLTFTGTEWLPAITQAADGTLWVVWTSSRSGNEDIWYKTSSDSGVTWSAPQQWTRFVGTDWLPAVAAMSDGSVAVAWSSDRAANEDIWFGIFGEREDISPPPYLHWIEHDPWPNPDANDTVAIRAWVSDETGISSVTLKWSRDGTPQANVTMYDDGAHDDYGVNDGCYGVQIGPFPAGTIIEYQVTVTDMDGNAILAPQYPMQFESLEPFVKTADILFVPDYGGNSTDWFRPYFTDALDSLGYSHDVWDTGLRGAPDSATLDLYTSSVVIWAVPYWGYFDDWDVQPAIEAYLDAGGKLFITGQNVAQSLDGTTLLSDYLHASHVQNDTNLYALNGTAGDPIGDGLALSISGGDGANNQYDTDEIDPMNPAVTVFTYDTAATTALAEPVSPEVTQPKQESGELGTIPIPALWDKPKEPPEQPVKAELAVGLQGIFSSGAGGLRVDTGIYKVVFFSFGFEGINSAADRQLVIERVLDWTWSLPGDLDFNCVVNVADIMRVASRWRMTDTDPDWNPRYDLNGDGIITVVDIMLVVKHWGETCG